MTELTPAEVDHFAKLARISLSAEETTMFSQELPKIVEFVEVLQSVQLGADLPKPSATELSDLRADEVSGKRLTPEQLAALAPEWRDGQNVVPAVFGETTDEG